MITAVINIDGFVKHLIITIEQVQYGRISIPVPRVLADLAYGEPPSTATMNIIEFFLRKYDKENHIAYFDFSKWI